MEFGRCYRCGYLRWLKPAKPEPCCPRCGDNKVATTHRANLRERLRIARGHYFYNLRINGLEALLPWNTAKILAAGLRPFREPIYRPGYEFLHEKKERELKNKQAEKYAPRLRSDI